MFWGAPYVVRVAGEFCRGHSKQLGIYAVPAREIPQHVLFSQAHLSMALGIFEKISLAIWGYEAKRFSGMCRTLIQ